MADLEPSYYDGLVHETCGTPTIIVALNGTAEARVCLGACSTYARPRPVEGHSLAEAAQHPEWEEFALAWAAERGLSWTPTLTAPSPG